MVTKSLHVKIEEELHKKLKIKVISENKKIQDYMAELIERDLKEEK